MAAGSFTFRVATPAGSVPKFLFSSFPFASPKTLRRHVRLPRPGLAARSSSLLASEMPRRENADFLKMESAFSSLLLGVEESLDDGKAESLGVNQVDRAPSDHEKVESLGVNQMTRAPFGHGKVESLDVNQMTRAPFDHRTVDCLDVNPRTRAPFDDGVVDRLGVNRRTRVPFDDGKVDSLGANQMSRARFADGKADRLGVNQRSRDPWNILEAAKEESTKVGGALPGPLAWRDASLRYANVMWFKGAYNVEILCREDEPEESIVRRFRQKVKESGVLRECQRRRYLETKQDTVKRKQRMVSMNRKRNKRSVNASNAWTQNAWVLSKEHLKPVDHTKKKKTSRKQYGQSRFNATKTAGSEKKDDIDDDYWGFVEEEEGVHNEAYRRQSH